VNSEELFSLLLLNRISNYSAKIKLRLLDKYGDYINIVRNRGEIEKLNNKPFRIGGYILDKKYMEYQKEKISAEIEFYKKNDITIIDYKSSYYPDLLHQIFDPPIVLFARGNIGLLNNDFLLGIVGSRRSTNRGLTSAYSISESLSKFGITIVSGMARGVDSYAHKGALNEKASTIAIMANGIDKVYPPENNILWEDISNHGLIMTEFPLGMPPLRYNFPRRNRIISGLSKAVLVVEAPKKSGALITAQYALEQGRDVMALPGKAGSEFFSGNNILIKEGAFLVENHSDILSILGKDKIDVKELAGLDKNSKLVYSKVEKDVLMIMGDDKVSFEDIYKELEYSVSRVISTLIMLEIKGIVKQKAGKYFYRVS